MGLQATSIKRYVIEYGNTRGFNYDPYTLENIFRSFCDDIYTGDDGSGGSTSAVWEINKEEYSLMLKSLEALDEEEVTTRLKNDWLGKPVKEEDPYSKDYILQHLRGYLDDTPEDSDYVRIAWL